MKNYSNFWLLLSIIALSVFAVACAVSPPGELVQLVGEVCKAPDISGFWGGLVHGIVSLFAIIAKYLFDSDIGVYNVCNTGGWYWFGFILGVGGVAGGGAAGGSRV